jgi:hypothetical protein
MSLVLDLDVQKIQVSSRSENSGFLRLPGGYLKLEE